jgi:hypothetical protein
VYGTGGARPGAGTRFGAVYAAMSDGYRGYFTQA